MGLDDVFHLVNPLVERAWRQVVEHSVEILAFPKDFGMPMEIRPPQAANHYQQLQYGADKGAEAEADQADIMLEDKDTQND